MTRTIISGKKKVVYLIGFFSYPATNYDLWNRPQRTTYLQASIPLAHAQQAQIGIYTEAEP